MKTEIVFIITLLLASAFIAIIAHEGTHLALADEARGICIGLCKNEAYPNGAYALAYGKHNELSRNENIANAAGLGTGLTFAIIAILTIIPKIKQ